MTGVVQIFPPSSGLIGATVGTCTYCKGEHLPCEYLGMDNGYEGRSGSLPQNPYLTPHNGIPAGNQV